MTLPAWLRSLQLLRGLFRLLTFESWLAAGQLGLGLTGYILDLSKSLPLNLLLLQDLCASACPLRDARVLIVFSSLSQSVQILVIHDIGILALKRVSLEAT